MDVPVTIQTWIDLVYLLAAVGFIVALKGLSSPKQARNGNLLGAAAALVAVGFTFADPRRAGPYPQPGPHVVAMVIGAVIAVPAARMVKMTAMPQMVAIFNGVGGGAAALISIVAFLIVATWPSRPSTASPRCSSACWSAVCPSRGAPSPSPSCRS